MLFVVPSLPKVFTTGLSDRGPTWDQALFALGGSWTGGDWPKLFPASWGWDQAAHLHPVGKGSRVVIHQIHYCLEQVLSFPLLHLFFSQEVIPKESEDLCSTSCMTFTMGCESQGGLCSVKWGTETWWSNAVCHICVLTLSTWWAPWFLILLLLFSKI